MKKLIVLLNLLGCAILPTSLLATTATSMSSFGGIEEPSAISHAGGTVTQGDTYVNITDRGSGVFRFLLRYHQGDWCDGDRDTSSTTMQRAEVKVLGPRQLRGETYVYQSTFRPVSTYRFATTNTCAVQQVKATDGDNGQALQTTFLTSQTDGRVAHGAGTGMTTVRTFTWAAGSATTIATRLKISSSSGSTDGSFEVAVNGSSFTGITNVKMERPGSTTYQPKWGLYRSQGNLNIDRGTDEYVEHSNVQANKVTAGGGTGITGFKRIVARHSGKDVVVESASTADGANVFQYTYSTGTTRNDEWEIISIGSGYYRVMNRHSGKALVVQSASTADGANVIQWTYGGTATNDEWAIEDVGGGYYRFINRNSGKALDVLNGGTTNGVNIQQATPDGGTNQQFQLISVP